MICTRRRYRYKSGLGPDLFLEHMSYGDNEHLVRKIVKAKFKQMLRFSTKRVELVSESIESMLLP